ncbi:MAG: D-alanyl-D-alanine carboxypeptidase family protein [Actinomycetota bacterium]
MGTRNIKRSLLVALASLVWSQVPGVSAATPSAEATILIDVSDGRTLSSHNPHKRRAIASTTKVMTALVVLEHSDPTETVHISELAEQVGSDDPLVSEVDLVKGEVLTVEELLYALLLPSANDAAVALAEHVSGSVDGFVDEMNATAKDLDAFDSSFKNPHGLDAPGHYSSAHDLALMTREAFKFPLFRKIVATPRSKIGGRELMNRNGLLETYPSANGVKTGHTKTSGRSLIASAANSGEELIAVVLGSIDPQKEARTLLEFGFQEYHRVTLTYKGKPWATETYGDGRTALLISDATVSLLVQKSDIQPVLDFDRKSQVLKAKTGRGSEVIQVPFHAACIRCVAAKRSRVVSSLWALLRPVAILMAELR